jgi:AAA domain
LRILSAPRHLIFLISPANLAGERASLVFNPQADFALARQLRTPAGAPLGDVYSFVSGLYFRGKRAYAEAFGRAPAGLSAGLVISPVEGLRFLHEPVTLDRLRGWADVDIDANNPRFVEPLVEHAVALERALGADAHFVLLGSVASDKYVRPLTRVFGDHLLFPSDFVGRGDMSRGALLLKAVREGQELGYMPVEGAIRHGPRPASAARQPPRKPVPKPAAAAPEIVVLMGLPGAGKTTFFQQRFAATHAHVSRDKFPNNRDPSRRQAILIAEALNAGKPVVVDNTNASRGERAAIFAEARRRGVRVIGYWFDCPPRECLARNAGREGRARIPAVGIFATAKRFEAPIPDEGFAALHVVQPIPGPDFAVTALAEAAGAAPEPETGPPARRRAK